MKRMMMVVALWVFFMSAGQGHEVYATEINCALPLPKIIAHRGGKEEFPENTIPAFQKSVTAGVDGVELDVQVTRDGIPVLFHPQTLPEGAPAKAISQLTLEQLQQWNATLPQEKQIRPLLDALKVIPIVTMVIVDLKSLPAKPLVEALIKKIPSSQWKRLVFYSTDHTHIDYLETRSPRAIHFEPRETTRLRGLTQLLADRCELANPKSRYVGFELYRDVSVAEKLTLGEGTSSVRSTFWTPQTVACTRRQAPHAAIVMIGINSAEDYDQAIGLGAQAIYTDAPVKILAHRNEIQKACSAPLQGVPGTLLEKGDAMITITAAWQAKPGKEKELKRHLETMVDQVRKNEPNCLLYSLHQGRDDKTKFFFYEQYKDVAAIETHKNTPHFKTLIANTESLIAKPVQVELLEVVK